MSGGGVDSCQVGVYLCLRSYSESGHRRDRPGRRTGGRLRSEEETYSSGGRRDGGDSMVRETRETRARGVSVGRGVQSLHLSHPTQIPPPSRPSLETHVDSPDSFLLRPPPPRPRPYLPHTPTVSEWGTRCPYGDPMQGGCRGCLSLLRCGSLRRRSGGRWYCSVRGPCRPQSGGGRRG